MDGCLRRLRVDRVPLVVLTHFHADHVDGLEGVLEGDGWALSRSPRWPTRSRAFGWSRPAARAGVPVRRASYGETGRLGPLPGR